MKEFAYLPMIIIAVFLGCIFTVFGGQIRLDLNHASQEQLQKLPGIGPASAKKIVQERDRRGGFRSVNDLLKVRGIGRNLVVRLRPYVTVSPYRRIIRDVAGNQTMNHNESGKE